METTALGKRIKQARKEIGYTQEQLAEKARISNVYLSEIERGLKLPSLAMFVNIASILNVPTDSLLRDQIDSGKAYTYNEITKKLDALTPKQRIAVSELVDVYIKNL